MQGYEVLNPKQIICTLDKKQKFEAELEVRVGRGFATGDENKQPDQADRRHRDRFHFLAGHPRANTRSKTPASVNAPTTTSSILEVWTDGRLTPDDALAPGLRHSAHHLDVFVNYDEDVIEFDETPAGVTRKTSKLKKLLNMSVNEIELSVRAANCLNNANITTVGQLAQKTEAEMLKYRNFGKKSLNEIKDKLQQLGLGLGHEIRSRSGRDADRRRRQPMARPSKNRNKR